MTFPLEPVTRAFSEYLFVRYGPFLTTTRSRKLILEQSLQYKSECYLELQYHCISNYRAPFRRNAIQSRLTITLLKKDFRSNQKDQAYIFVCVCSRTKRRNENNAIKCKSAFSLNPHTYGDF